MFVMPNYKNNQFGILAVACLTLLLIGGAIGYQVRELTAESELVATKEALNLEKIQNDNLLERQRLLNLKMENDRKANEARISEAERQLHASRDNCSFGRSYVNTVMGIEVQMPSLDWCFPSHDHNDPHIYSSEGCRTDFNNQSCRAFEIQDHTSGSSELAIGYEERYQRLVEEKRNPYFLRDLIKGAIVIKSDAPGPAEGWTYEYDIYFENTSKKLLIFTGSNSVEDVIGSLSLL